jgi:hypothetical protein
VNGYFFLKTGLKFVLSDIRFIHHLRILMTVDAF